MAIGSDPEIGVQFGTWGKMDDTARTRWWYHMQEAWGPTLMEGYGTVVYVDSEKRKSFCAEILVSLPEMR